MDNLLALALGELAYAVVSGSPEDVVKQAKLITSRWGNEALDAFRPRDVLHNVSFAAALEASARICYHCDRDISKLKHADDCGWYL